MTEIIRDEDLIKFVEELISVVGITDVGTVLRDFTKAEAADISQVPEEFRRYIHGDTIQKLPKGLVVYKGVRDGIYIDLRQLKMQGLSDSEAEELVGGATTPEHAVQHHERLSTSKPKPDQGHPGQDDTEIDPRIDQNQNQNKVPLSGDEPNKEQAMRERLANLGRILLDKYGIDVCFITNKGGSDMEAESLVGEKILMGGFKNQQKIKIIFMVDGRLVNGGASMGKDNLAAAGGEKSKREGEAPESKPSSGSTGGDGSRV